MEQYIEILKITFLTICVLGSAIAVIFILLALIDDIKNR